MRAANGGIAVTIKVKRSIKGEREMERAVWLTLIDKAAIIAARDDRMLALGLARTQAPNEHLAIASGAQINGCLLGRPLAGLAVTCLSIHGIIGA